MDFAVTIDFFDDVFFGGADWDEPILRALIAGLAGRGASSVHWIDYGGIEDGGWDAGSYFDPAGKGQRFIHAVPDPMRVVCDEAHRHGMQVCSVLKVNDLALGVPPASFPVGGGPQPPVGLPHVGGSGSWALRWLREHPQVRYRLHPALVPVDSGRPIRTIRLWHDSPVPPEPLPELEIRVSSDNGSYRPYTGPLRVRRELRSRRPPLFAPAPERRYDRDRRCFCITLDELDIREPFVCLKPEPPVDYGNTLAALVEVLDAAGDPVAVTFGVAACQPYGQAGHDWRTAGISFDTSRRTLLPGRGKKYSAGRDRFSLAERLTGSPNRQVAPSGCPDEEWVILGLARGRNSYLTGIVDMAHESVRAWLCGMIDRALEAGADAVDIRACSHTETLDWENYGFSEPAMAEFQRRHGVDVATQPFDRHAWHALRGEYFDRFMIEASGRVHKRGAALYAHVSPLMDRLPEWPEDVAWHNQQWNWRRWITDGLIDGATLKGCRIDREPFSEVMSLCRRCGRSTLLNNKPAGLDREAAWLDAIAQAEAAGVDTFNLYECASLVRLLETGDLDFTHPRVWRRVKGE